MDAVHTCVALGPLAAYLLVLACMNLRPRPMVFTGGQDTALLGGGIAGFVVVGPMELFWPDAAGANFGAWVWLMLLALYGLALTLVVLFMRPRLVVYNAPVEELRQVLGQVAQELDPNAAWVGESLHLPGLHVQLHLEHFRPLRNVQLVSTGNEQSSEGWCRLKQSLAGALRRVSMGPNPYGACLLSFAAAILAAIGYWLFAQGPLLAEGLRRMLRWEG